LLLLLLLLLFLLLLLLVYIRGLLSIASKQLMGGQCGHGAPSGHAAAPKWCHGECREGYIEGRSMASVALRSHCDGPQPG
jgi:hypothetical protein